MLTPEEKAEQIMSLVDWDWEDWKPNAKETIVSALIEFAREAVAHAVWEEKRSYFDKFTLGESLTDQFLKARAEALEEAAKVCDSLSNDSLSEGEAEMAAAIAAEIRALKEGK